MLFWETTRSVSAAEATTILNVDPGSTMSKIARFFISSWLGGIDLIEIEGRPAGHCQDLAGLGIYNDARGVVGLELPEGIVELRLQDGLQVHVDRQLDIHPVAGRLFLAPVDDDLASGAIAFDVAKSVDPSKIVLHAPLNALDADDILVIGILAAEEAEHVAQQRTVRIGARRILVKVEAAQRFFLHGSLEGEGLFFVQLGKKDFVFAACLQFIQKRLLRNAENRCGESGERFRVS